MYCATCGHVLPVGHARFCPSCGRPTATGGTRPRRPGRTAAIVLTACVVLAAAGVGVASVQLDDEDAPLAGGTLSAARVSPTAAPSASASASPATSPRPVGPADLANAHGAAVLRISATGCEQDGSGTGFAIDERHVVTNHHVVSVDPTPEVVGRDGSVRQGRVIGWRESPDIAVVEVDEPLPATLDWAETSRLTEGQSLVALGYPVPELDFAVTQADIVSFKVRDGVRQAIRTDGKVDRGNSGGPALTADGRVAGVVTEMDTNDAGFQLVALLYTADALAGEVDDILASPVDVEADCDAGPQVLPEDWVDDLPDEAFSYGDDPVLDGLQDDCTAGDMAACDELYQESPVDSDYESFGGTCGERVGYLETPCTAVPDRAEPEPAPEPEPEPEVVEPEPPAPDGDPLAGLRGACAAGDSAACDQLWIDSPVGSEEEQFGATCGGRLEADTGTCGLREGGA